MKSLELREVSYSYRNRYQTVHAVREVSAVFEPGQFTALIGKSGSGKTTLLSLLAGLDTPTSGEVLFDDIPTDKMDLDNYRSNHAAVIYQSYNLFPYLTVLENVMYPLEIKNTPRHDALNTAAKVLENVGLGELFHKRFPSMLSGGEQQRVAIARALTGSPEIILADEPTGNLDTENGGIILSLLQSLTHEKHLCVIVVTHDFSIANQADVVLQMVDGRFATCAPPE